MKTNIKSFSNFYDEYEAVEAFQNAMHDEYHVSVKIDPMYTYLRTSDGEYDYQLTTILDFNNEAAREIDYIVRLINLFTSKIGHDTSSNNLTVYKSVKSTGLFSKVKDVATTVVYNVERRGF